MLVSELIPKLRKVIRDEARKEVESFFGDGVLSKWTFRHSIIVENSVTVFLDGSVLDPANYSVDYVNAEITFNSSPSANVVVEVQYKYTDYTDNFLLDYLVDAISLVSSISGLNHSVTVENNEYTVDTPTYDVNHIWCMVANYLLRRDNLESDAEAAYNWADADVRIDEVANIRAREGLLDDMWEKIMNELTRIAVSSDGALLVGGTEPSPYGVGADGSLLEE